MDPVYLYLLLGVAVVGIVAFFVLRRKAPALPKEAQDREEPKLATPATPVAKTIVGYAAPAKPAEGATPAAIAAEPAKAADAAPAPAAAPPTEAAPAPVEQPVVAAPATATRASIPPPKTSSDDIAVLRKGLGATRGGIIAKLRSLFVRTPTIDLAVLDDIEEILLTADVGVPTTQRIQATLRSGIESGKISSEDGVWEALRAETLAIFDGAGLPTVGNGSPSVVLFVGVNGVGKTTTIGKLASKLVADGKSVLLVAGDTYRAAAVIQLEVWGKRVGCEIAKGRDRADPSAVVFDAIKKAQEKGIDVVLCDTAGRLQTKAPLMDELAKIGRTIEKALGRPADETLLVLDATTGQNAVSQAQQFKEACSVSGVVLTKLDGTAKGGVVLGIVDEHRIPVRYVGIGERVEDLRIFEAKAFVDALFDKSSDDVSE
jgi:fused signal recognition particle receptor